MRDPLNPGTKFLPGDRVRVAYKRAVYVVGEYDHVQRLDPLVHLVDRTGKLATCAYESELRKVER